MELTKEQHDIINSTGNIKVNAVAGSGKTTTIVEYAKTKPNDKLLYIAFNKTIKQEAIDKFRSKNITNITVETAHSLAYKHIVATPDSNYTINHLGYKTKDIIDMFKLSENCGQDEDMFATASHVLGFCSYFCNSNKSKVSEVNYLEALFSLESIEYATQHYESIEHITRKLLARMNSGKIPVTHDFYLKKFQLSKPKLHYDYILFDEGQDASEVMLDIFFHQNATKVIVGDTNQQIYGWRFAINSLSKSDYTEYPLSVSFRFNKDIADLSMDILNWKHDIGCSPNITGLVGAGKYKDDKIESRAIIARTNIGLLAKAVDYVEVNSIRNTKIYFEGNISSYTYANEGASLYDVLNLYQGNLNKIRDPFIKSMGTITNLALYVNRTNDVELSTMLELVKKYGSRIHHIITSLKSMHVSDAQRSSADIILSTLHRCKGMEYDEVELASDFCSHPKLLLLHKQQYSTRHLNEEINLLYVAVTRTKKLLKIPASLFPDDVDLKSNKSIKFI